MASWMKRSLVPSIPEKSAAPGVKAVVIPMAERVPLSLRADSKWNLGMVSRTRVGSSSEMMASSAAAPSDA
jgi:hypothetical protein